MSFINNLKQRAPVATISEIKRSDLPHNNNGFNNPPENLPPLELSVNLILNKKIIELNFSRDVSEYDRQRLHNNFWSYNSGVAVWTNVDTTKNRKDLNDWYATDLEINETVPDITVATVQSKSEYDDLGLDDPIPPQVLKDLVAANEKTLNTPLPAVQAMADQFNNTPFEIYKKQVKELCIELKVDCADLALLAVASLHKQTFKN